MEHHIAEALVLSMFAAALAVTIIALREVYHDYRTANTIEGLYQRFERAIKQL